MIRTAVAWLGKLAGENLSVDVNRVYLDNTQITDAELAHLRGLTHLQRLSLDGTQVTDAGLRHLKGLTYLTVLVLSGTKVTDVGAERLQQASGAERLQKLQKELGAGLFEQVFHAELLEQQLPHLEIKR